MDASRETVILYIHFLKFYRFCSVAFRLIDQKHVRPRCLSRCVCIIVFSWLLGSICLIIIIINQFNPDFNEVPFPFDSLFSNISYLRAPTPVWLSVCVRVHVFDRCVYVCAGVRLDFINPAAAAVTISPSSREHTHPHTAPNQLCVYARVCVFITYACMFMNCLPVRILYITI